MKEKTFAEQAAQPYRCLCVDFDGCLCTDEYPEIGKPNMQVITALKARVDQGWEVILFTCREGYLLAEAIGWCKAHGIYFHAVNQNTERNIHFYGNDCRKPYADEYWDDRAVAVHDGRVWRHR